jgi:hypothetical protein
MKIIDISDEAFLVISGRAQRVTNGSIADLIDRLVGVAKDRRDYEPLPANVESQFVRAHHPESLSDEEAICIILDLIRKEAPRRFESIVGVRFKVDPVRWTADRGK